MRRRRRSCEYGYGCGGEEGKKGKRGRRKIVINEKER